MSAVLAEHNDDRNLPVSRTDGSAILAVISRAASDPNTDVDKMERLMAMYERLQAKQAEADFAAALAEMQDELPSIGERGNAAGRYTYALWEDINAAIKPILKRHGFALSFRTDPADGIAVTGILSHRSGHKAETTIKLPPDTSGNKPQVQAVASSVSYGKRYTAGALLNLTSHGEDDDAFAATDQKAAEWIRKAEAVKTHEEYASLRAEMVKSYGTVAKIPPKVREAFNKASAETKPKD
jgi:hypothetical protein